MFKNKLSWFALAAGASVVTLLGTGLVTATTDTATVTSASGSSGVVGAAVSSGTALVNKTAAGTACSTTAADYSTTTPSAVVATIDLGGNSATLDRLCVLNKGSSGAELRISFASIANTDNAAGTGCSPNEFVDDPGGVGGCDDTFDPGELGAILEVDFQNCNPDCTFTASGPHDFTSLGTTPQSVWGFVAKDAAFGFRPVVRVKPSATAQQKNAAQSDKVTWTINVTLAFS